MKKIDQLLNRLYEEVIQEGDNLKCEVCGRIVLIQEKGVGPLICCGKPMIRIGETVSESDDKKEDKPLNQPFRLPSGSKKKFGVYVKNDKGNVVKVTFGDPNMEIKRDDPERRKSFRARHGCDNPGPRWKAKYWSCKFWQKGKSVSNLLDQEDMIKEEKKDDNPCWKGYTMVGYKMKGNKEVPNCVPIEDGEPEKMKSVKEAGFDNMPKGWDKSSVRKFARSLVDKGGGKSEGFFDKCVKKMTGKLDDPEGFCASVKDEVYSSTYWRGKDKPEAEVRKDTKKHKNVKQD